MEAIILQYFATCGNRQIFYRTASVLRLKNKNMEAILFFAVTLLVIYLLLCLFFKGMEVVVSILFSTSIWIWALLGLVVYGCFFAPADSWTRIIPEFFGALKSVLGIWGGVLGFIVALCLFFKYLKISVFKAIFYALIALVITGFIFQAIVFILLPFFME